MARRLTIEELSRQPLPGMDMPSGVAFAPHAPLLTFLAPAEPGGNVRSLFAVDLRSGERRLLLAPDEDVVDEATLSRDEKLRRERRRERSVGITEYAWAPRAARPTLLVPENGRLVILHPGEPGGDEPRRLSWIDDAANATLSPDGGHVAFVRDGDLWAVPTSGGDPIRLTDDAEPGVTNGLAEFAAAEELDRHTGTWWSHAGRALAFAHVDERGVPPFHLQHLGGERPELEEHRYPFAGGPNARVTLRVSSLAGVATDVALPMADDDYLARVVAVPAGGWLVAVLARAQDRLTWLHVDEGGAASLLWEERGAPWLNLDADTRALGDGRILRTTESSGFRHLELRAPDGTRPRPLTAGEWVVTRVVAADAVRGEVLCMATADGVLERHLYRVPLDAREPVTRPERLTAEPGWHDAVASEDGAWWADTWSSLEQAPRLVVHRPAGGERLVIHEPTATADGLSLAVPELRTLRAANGETPLHAAVYHPEERAGVPPPCVVWVYGGPHSQYVANRWDVTAHLVRQYLRQHGVLVLVVDNRGTNYRGLAFEAALAGALGSVELDDQAAAVEQLAAAGLLDRQRVAITGGSYGGFMTVRALLRRPDLFRAGVAWAPVVAWDGYDTAYTERYLGDPTRHSEAYDASSLLGDVGALRGQLLVQHGMVDENVHLRHTVRLLQAAAQHDVEIALQLFPGERHSGRSPAALASRDRRAIRHLLGALGVPLPPELRPARGSPQAAS